MRTWMTAVACVAMATSAGATVLCARQRADGSFNATVKIRDSCRSSETQLDPATLGLQGPKGDPGTPGPALLVKDSNGATLGFYFREAGIEYAVRSVGNGAAVDIYVDRDHGDAIQKPLFYHDAPDCPDAGQLLNYSLNGVTSAYRYSLSALGAVGGSTLFYETGPIQPIYWQSESFIVSSAAECPSPPFVFMPPERCCYTQSSCGASGCYATGMPFASVQISGAPFVPPFHIEGP